MNIKVVLRQIGFIIMLEGLFMLIPGIMALFADTNLNLNPNTQTTTAYAFFLPACFMIAGGGLTFKLIGKNVDLTIREGVATVALTWFVISFFGSLPFYLAHVVPTITDGIFESASGFTTTGATVFASVEDLPWSILFWRAFTHWIGGMGVLVFMLAVLPGIKASSVQLLRAETTGITPSKIVPKIKDTASIMYKIYLTLTLICFLCLVIAGMHPFDALIHAMSTAGTGGMSNRNMSIGAYDNPIFEGIIILFMIIFMINFSIYHMILLRHFRAAAKNEELRLFFIVLLSSIALVTINLISYYGSFLEALRQAAFQVTSIMSTTGFSTADYNLWPTFSKLILLLAIVMGGCAGSTAGGLKVIRLLVLLKTVRSESRKRITRGLVMPVKVDGKVLDNEIISSVFQLFFMYALLVFCGSLLISLEGYDLETCITAMMTMVSNVGPGLGGVGPLYHFGAFSGLSKLFFGFCMIVGRLEIIPVLMLFMPSLWKRS